jgi:GNAT superfamily N-acetyltransferase
MKIHNTQLNVTLKSCSENNIKTILDGINKFNLDKVPANNEFWTPLNFVVKNNKSKVIGGILSGIGYWSGLEIKILWVDENYRNQGVGSWILDITESMAKEKGADISILDTFDFQAEDFYKKHDYITFGVINNFPKDHRRSYFYKRLV